MRESWLEFALPAQWRLKPLKAVAGYMVSNVDKIPSSNEEDVRLCNYSDVYHNEFITLELELMRTTATLEEIQKFRLFKNDVVITKDSESWDDIAVPTLVQETADDLVCGYHLAIIRPMPELLNGRFLLRCLQAKQIRLQLELEATGVTRFGLPKGAIGSALLPIPPLEQQQKIADYLDRETAQIDALILEKETMLGLLEQKRAALVSRAVTRGLNPRVELKDSGLEWLGEIPAHWELKRLKFALFGIEQGWSPQCENTPALPEQWGVLKVGAVNGWEFEPEQNKALPTEIEPLEAYEIQPGDVLVSRANTINLLGSAALVRDVRSKLLLCDKLYRLRLDTALLDAEFLVRLLRSSVGRYSMEREASGTSGSMQNIGQDTLRNLWIMVPPLEEQKAIIRFIQRETRQVEEVRREIERSAALLRERRSALITAAVTGQLALEEMIA